MSGVVHLVVGPDQHGVVLHGCQTAQACGHPLLRVRPGEDWPLLGDADLVHLPFTDRLLAPELDDAAARFRQLVALLSASGAALSVTLHDVPHDDSPLQRRRRELYAEVIRATRNECTSSARASISASSRRLLTTTPRAARMTAA